MNELVTALRQFIARDVMYILGGSCALSSLILLLGENNPLLEELPTAGALLWAGVAYITGFAIQETLSLTPLVTTQVISRPGPVVKFFYARFTRQDWEEIDCSNWTATLANFEENAPERTYQNYQRIISLMHIGTAVGSSLYVSSLLLLINAFFVGGALAWVVFGACTFLSFALAVTAWVKGAQKTQFVLSWSP